MYCSVRKLLNLPTHRKRVTIMEPEVFEDLNIDYTIERDLSKIVIRQPLLFPLSASTLYQKRNLNVQSNIKKPYN